jgi:hypothetical protein
MKTKIRIEVLNMPLRGWHNLKRMIVDDYYIEVTPKGLIDLIGFDGGHFLSAKLNEQEQAFVNEYYKIGRELLNAK